MEGFYALRGELREKFYALVRSSETEERFIEFIRSSLKKSNKFDVRALEVILDLSLAVVDQNGNLSYKICDSQNVIHSEDIDQQVTIPDPNSYDADDEGLDETFIFPCHLTFDDCHPEQLFDYHRDCLKATRTNSTQIVKHPKICEFVIDFLFQSLKAQFKSAVIEDDCQPGRRGNFSDNNHTCNSNSTSTSEDVLTGKKPTFDKYLESMTLLIKRLNKVCSMEKKNCRILSRTNILDMLMSNILYLIQEIPDKQYIYLEPLLRLAFTLTDYKINGTNLKRLFSIIKEDNADTNVVLRNFERLLNHHYKILKNIQPSKSINFPTASRIAEEIEPNSYVSNSWHWRLKSKVIEFKRKRSRSIGQSSMTANNRPIKEDCISNADDKLDHTKSESVNDRITPSWLECSIMAPLSNISPLIQDGKVKFCCSMWMSVCGDLLVIDDPKHKKVVDDNEGFKVSNWRAANGHWLRLTSRRRMARRYKERVNQKRPRSRRSSAKLRRLQAFDKEDEEREEIEEMIKKSEMELNQPSHNLNGLRFMEAPKIYNSTSLFKSCDTIEKKITKGVAASEGKSTKPPKEFLGRRASDNSQELLMHIISFALDTLTIEIWLNVKCMTFCARACRVAREGQTNILDQVTFPSHLEANGDWSHIVFNLDQVTEISNSDLKMMQLGVMVNGSHKEKEKLHYRANKSPLTNFACLIGCERSTFGYVWKLSQFSVYKNRPPKDIPIYLLGKGPDFWSFTNFRQQSILPLPDITQRSIKNLMHPKILGFYSAIDEERCLNWLTQNVVIAYVSHQPEHFLDYSSSMNTSNDHSISNSADRFIPARILNFSRSLRFNTNHCFGSALVEAGGIESVLICFADVIRRAHQSATTHSLAFSILLKMSQTNQHHLNKFLDELNGLKLTEFILAHPDCIISKPLLGHYLDFCLMKKGEHSLIKSPKLFYHLLSCWRAWHKDVRVAKLLYRKLIRLLQPIETCRKLKTDERKVESYYINHNFKMMNEAGAIDILMGILRECLVPLDDGVSKINHELVELIVNLISLLIKHPPGLDVMLDIMEFLLFLHPDENAYVAASSDKISFLHKLSCEEKDTVVYDGLVSRARSPLSTSSSNRSVENVRSFNDRSGSNSDIGSSQSRIHSRDSSNEEVFRSIGNHIPEECSENLTQYLINYNLKPRKRLNTSASFNWAGCETTMKTDHDPTKGFHEIPEHLRCSNRDYATANIADMLASIVKLTLSDSKKILTEALQKPIIDARKLIILANSSSSFVREKVLRLFLYCIRACYTLKLKSVLSKYQQDTTSPNFKLCMPIQLIARQLLKYPTTIKMIQLCYGIIIGIEEFETVETVCPIFDIETIKNNLQLNTLILMIRLMAQLQEPREILSAVRFVQACVKQLLNLGEDDVLSILIKNNLVESLMRIYFSYVEHEIIRSNACGNQNIYEENSDDYTEIAKELDRTLIVVVRYYIQNLLKCDMAIQDLLTYFDLMNTYVPHKYQSILRDRKAKVLTVMFQYCKHYEECARRKTFSGKVVYYLKSLFANDDFSTFSNVLTDSHFESHAMFVENSSFENIPPKSYDNGNNMVVEGVNAADATNLNNESYPNTIDDSQSQNSSNGYNSIGNIDTTDEEGSLSSDSRIDLKEDQVSGAKFISENDVIERFKATLEFACELLTTRELGVIPSPLERQFIIKYIRMLSDHLYEFQSLAYLQAKESKLSLWSLMLPKLERMLRSNFSQLVLYLLSPCDSMNLDERKYYALTLLEIFKVEQLVKLLDDGGTRTNFKVLFGFVRDLIDHSHSVFLDSDEGESDEDDRILGDDTEVKLNLLARSIEQELSCPAGQNGNFDKYKRPKITDETIVSTKFRDIWLSNLAQAREDAREKLTSIKIENQLVSGASIDDLDEDLNRIDEAFSITKEVVDDKNEQRKVYLEELKQNKVFNYHIRQQWLSLIIGHTHERAVWFIEGHYPSSWELNPVEGPSRIRRRLRACKMMLDSRYFRSPKQGHKFHSLKSQMVAVCDNSDGEPMSASQQDLLADDWYNQYSPHPLCSMVINHEQSMDSNKLRIKMFTTDKIHYHCDASIIRPNEVCKGEISIASWCIHFIGRRSENYEQHLNSRQSQLQADNAHSSFDGEVNPPDISSNRQLSSATRAGKSATSRRSAFITSIVEDLWFDEIVEIWDRRYQLQDVGLEIFLTNSMTYLISFRQSKDREDFKQKLMSQQHKIINLQRFNLNTSLNRFSQLWRDGRMTNFDYLTCLNKLAGRSFNDLMQYPVFPFVLANYTSKTLDLNQPSNFRKLAKPMAIQYPEKEVTFMNNYYDSQSTNISVGLCGMKQPYHYSNHYSNSATVLHFLVRLPPFTQMLIQYQDNNFDQPDRTFHAIENTWQLITRDSNTDFKELIPEFFFLPEMFVNFEQFDLGRKQNNELVDDVKLPAWCQNSDARLFTLIHRQALESAYVSKNLHHWIDLIFGYKQTGKAAVEALNVFHPATYYGMIDLNGQQNSSSLLNATNSSISARSPASSSDYFSTAEMNAYQPNMAKDLANDSDPVKRILLHSRNRRQQADIERLALETMIKTYGQMPRQLFAAPIKQRIYNSVLAQHITNISQFSKQVSDENQVIKKFEPLRQVSGLRWGSFVGSPEENDIVAVKHKRIIPEDVRSKKGRRSPKDQMPNRTPVLFNLCLLPNGEIAILRNDTSLMLDYRADRKSGGAYQLSLPSARYSRRAGLSRVARMNLFSNMVISRQQFSWVETSNLSASLYDTTSTTSPSLKAFTSKAKFSPESLSLVSWYHLDGIIRIRHPALNSQKSSIPLVLANSIVDTMSTCVSVPELNLLLVGYKSGSICAHIVSTAYETVPAPNYSQTILPNTSSTALSHSSAVSSAVHFLHTTTHESSALANAVPLGAGKVSGNLITGEPYSPVFLAGETLQSVRSINKATRWLYCHSKKVNCMRINVSFGVVVTGSDDGTSVVWDLNSLTYVRTIDYKFKSPASNKLALSSPPPSPASPMDKYDHPWSGRFDNSRYADYLCNCEYQPYTSNTSSSKVGTDNIQNTQYFDGEDSCRSNLRDPLRQCCICGSGVNLIAISDTLGDIVSVKDISNRLALASDCEDINSDYGDDATSISSGRGNRSNMSTTSIGSENSSSSVLYVHTINGSLVGFVNCHTQATAVCYSNAPEGISVNVIVVGLSDGLIRLYNSWDLSRVKEFHVSGLGSPVTSLLYSRDNQLLYVAYEDGQMVVLRNRKKSSATLPKEWLLSNDNYSFD